MKHQIIVGNIGTVYDGSSRDEARTTFDLYASLARNNRGRAAGEPVTWMIDDSLFKEQDGTLEEEI